MVENYAELARPGGGSRARITRIMDLLNLPAAELDFMDSKFPMASDVLWVRPAAKPGR